MPTLKVDLLHDVKKTLFRRLPLLTLFMTHQPLEHIWCVVHFEHMCPIWSPLPLDSLTSWVLVINPWTYTSFPPFILLILMNLLDWPLSMCECVVLLEQCLSSSHPHVLFLSMHFSSFCHFFKHPFDTLIQLLFCVQPKWRCRKTIKQTPKSWNGEMPPLP